MPSADPRAPVADAPAADRSDVAALAREVRFLRRATALLALALLVLVGAAFARPRAPRVQHEEFEELTVGRINVVEPDGTLRFVLSNRAQFPGDFFRGTENARPDRRAFAGMLFVNDEGTENGGLIQAGALGPGGVEASLSLTFDRFRQDQVLQLLHAERAGSTRTGVAINDRPDPRRFPIDQLKQVVAELEALDEAARAARIAEMQQRGELGAHRAWYGTTTEGDAVLLLNDGLGRTRLRLAVPAAGEPRFEVLDPQGRVTGTLAVAPAGAK